MTLFTFLPCLQVLSIAIAQLSCWTPSITVEPWAPTPFPAPCKAFCGDSEEGKGGREGKQALEPGFPGQLLLVLRKGIRPVYVGPTQGDGEGGEQEAEAEGERD